jgi:MscS family membrane protein
MAVSVRIPAMLDRLRFALAALVLLVGATVVFAQDGPEAPPAAAPLPAERASPRDTASTFVTAVKDVVQKRVPDVEEARDRAIACISVAGWERSAAWDLAVQLKAVLDYHGRIDWDDWPDEVGIGSSDSWSLVTEHGPVTLVRTPSGWLFSAESVQRAPTMAAAFAAAGVERYAARTVGDRISERFPALAGRVFVLAHWQWIGLVLMFLTALFVHRIIAYVVANIIGGILGRKGWLERASAAAKNAGRPVGLFGVALLLAFGGPWLELPVTPVDVHKWLTVIAAKTFASIGAVLILYRIADVVAERLAEAAAETESRLDDQLVPLVRKSIKILVTVVGVLFILDNLEADIWSLLAGASIAGVAIAFAAKDTVANLFGSLTVFLDRPFHVGDWVKIGSVEGTVEEVGFRSTRVRTFYNSLVSVPNSHLVDGIVDNLGERQYRRFKTTVGIRYDTPPQRIEAFCHGIRQIVLANDHMRHDYFEVYLNDWGASSLNILVYVFFSVPDWDAELRERQNFMLEVIRLANELGVGFAFPTQTLDIEGLPDRRPTTPDERSGEELAAIVDRYRKGGTSARPEGSQRFSTRERTADQQEARGDG